MVDNPGPRKPILSSRLKNIFISISCYSGRGKHFCTLKSYCDTSCLPQYVRGGFK